MAVHKFIFFFFKGEPNCLFDRSQNFMSLDLLYFFISFIWLCNKGTWVELFIVFLTFLKNEYNYKIYEDSTSLIVWLVPFDSLMIVNYRMIEDHWPNVVEFFIDWF